jgi:hypothetical protein
MERKKNMGSVRLTCGLPFIQNNENKQTALSTGLRITAVALGTIAATVGILALLHVPGLNALGSIGGWVSTGLGAGAAILGAAIKGVKEETNKKNPSPEISETPPVTTQLPTDDSTSSAIEIYEEIIQEETKTEEAPAAPAVTVETKEPSKEEKQESIKIRQQECRQQQDALVARDQTIPHKLAGNAQRQKYEADFIIEMNAVITWTESTHTLTIDDKSHRIEKAKKQITQANDNITAWQQEAEALRKEATEIPGKIEAINAILASLDKELEALDTAS